MQFRIKNYSSTGRLYLFWVLPMTKEPTAVQSRRPNNKSVGFFTTNMNMSNIFRRPIRGLFGRPDQICQFQLIGLCLVGDHSTMDRLIILVGRLKKSMGPPKYFFKVHLVGRFVPLVGVMSRPVESPLKTTNYNLPVHSTSRMHPFEVITVLLPTIIYMTKILIISWKSYSGWLPCRVTKTTSSNLPCDSACWMHPFAAIHVFLPFMLTKKWPKYWKFHKKKKKKSPLDPPPPLGMPLVPWIRHCVR